MKITYKYRVKDKHFTSLNKQARAINFVWNFCNETQKHALKWDKKWPSAYDLQKLTAGSSKELGVSADSIGKVCEQYAKSRAQFRKRYLRWRGKKSLGWIPLKGREVKIREGAFVTFGKSYSVWLSREVPAGAKICDGSNFSQDSRWCWYINLVVDVPEYDIAASSSVGIDLGLKDIATLSTGEKIAAPQFYRRSEKKLAIAQRARKKRQVSGIRAKAANQRKDFLHKVSTNIVKNHGLIVVGNVNSSGLAKTRMAKSVLDAGWYSFKQMLAYKSIGNGARYIEVNESFTTQTCSDCGSVSGPKGREGLGVREWQCACGSIHDRDHNSALNILRIGQDTLTGATA